MYMSEKDEYKNMRRDGRALAYKHATKHIKKRINEKGKEIVENSFDNAIDRIKGHKENFQVTWKYLSSTQQRMNLEE